jgi:DNA-directed RNA polymerase II subunit RPB9
MVPGTDTANLVTSCGCSNNILYPRENKEEKRLEYACGRCDFSEDAEQSCVYRNEIHHTAE